MKHLTIGAISAANITALAGALFVLIEKYPYNQSDTFLVLLISIPLFWLLGFIFAAVLLAILAPVYESTNTKVSLAIFLGVGFGIPFALGYFGSSIPAHGNPSSLEHNFFEAMLLILAYAFTGMIAAYFAWRSIRKRNS